MIVIQHKVADFESWKRSFDSDPLGRAKNGVTRHTVYRPANDPAGVVVNLEFATLEEAEKFLLKLREMWQRVGQKIGFGDAGGVEARILVDVEHVTY